MTSAHNTPTVQPGRLLDDSALLSLEDLAHPTCHMAPDWVSERLEAGLLQADSPDGHWRLSAPPWCARRLAQLETTFDADPHLAALRPT